MNHDRSEGWDDVADAFVAARSATGAALVRDWAQAELPPHATVVDIGCGSGVPITQVLVDQGLDVFAIDASPALLAHFRQRFPGVPSACEAAQDSAFFGRRFDAAVAVGLIFLLSDADQARLIARVGNALQPGGRFLFTAPSQACAWPDLLTGRQSRSLGLPAYQQLLRTHGLRLLGCERDEGNNHYYDAIREGAAPHPD